MIAAWTALIIWPFVSIACFRTMRMPAAACTTIIGGYLLLPELIFYNLPGLPSLNKTSIPVLTALAMIAITAASKPDLKAPVQPRVLNGWIPRDFITIGLIGLLILGTIGTTLNNRDPFFYGPFGMVRGLRLYDGLSMLLDHFIMILAPLMIGRKILATREGQKTLLSILAVWVAIYGLAALYEVRMSPQIHSRIYGFSPSHSFLQSIRYEGWRPNVMLRHGLHLAIITALATVAAAGLMRYMKGERAFWGMLSGWLFVVLVACKSIGALALTVLVLPIVWILKPRAQMLVAASVSVVVLTYPALRAADIVPVDNISSIARGISPERAQSFDFRVYHEEILLDKARQKPIFGWGSFARNRVFDENGRDISVTDGAWVIEFGVGGWARYIAVFGLLAWPALGLLYRRKNIDPLSAIVALVLAVKLLDLLPNAELVPTIWLLAGSLIGRLEMRDASDADETQFSGREEAARKSAKRRLPPVEKPRATPVYARTFARDEGRSKPRVKTGSAPVPKRRAYHRDTSRKGYRK